jgi:hypothetical protein
MTRPRFVPKARHAELQMEDAREGAGQLRGGRSTPFEVPRGRRCAVADGAWRRSTNWWSKPGRPPARAGSCDDERSNVLPPRCGTTFETSYGSGLPQSAAMSSESSSSWICGGGANMIAPRGSHTGAAARAGDTTSHTTANVAKASSVRRRVCLIATRSLAREGARRQAQPWSWDRREYVAVRGCFENRRTLRAEGRK